MSGSMWAFTLLEEHNGNLEFCSLGNSQIKYPIFFSFVSPWTPKLLDVQSCLFFSPSSRMWRIPSRIRDPRMAVPLRHCMPPRPSPKKRPCRIHYCTLETLEPLAGAGAGRFPGITAPWHGRQAGKKPGSLACDIDLLSSKRVNEIHTSCKMPKVGSIGLFLVKTISSESLPLLQNHLFLLPWCSLRSSQD